MKYDLDDNLCARVPLHQLRAKNKLIKDQKLALKECVKAIDSLMDEFVSKKSSADWLVINNALCDAERLSK